MAQIQADEISRLLREEIENYEKAVNVAETGSVISVGELSYASTRVRAQTFRVLEVLTAMAAIYWVLGYPQAKLVDWINHRWRRAE